MRDFLRRFGGLYGERFHLGRHYGKTAAGFAGACRFDRGIERQKIGLAGDVLDEFDDVADPLRNIGERGDVLIGRCGVGGGAAHDTARLIELAADLLDRHRKLGRRRGGGLDIAGGFVRAVHGGLGAPERVIRPGQ